MAWFELLEICAFAAATLAGAGGAWAQNVTIGVLSPHTAGGCSFVVR